MQSYRCSRAYHLDLGLSTSADQLNSEAPVYHLGLYREKVSLNPVECACPLWNDRYMTELELYA